MPSYTYRARNAAGKPVTGTMEARTKNELVQGVEIDSMTAAIPDHLLLLPGL